MSEPSNTSADVREFDRHDGGLRLPAPRDGALAWRSSRTVAISSLRFARASAMGFSSSAVYATKPLLGCAEAPGPHCVLMYKKT